MAGPSFPRMDDVQRARAHISAGQKRVKGPLYLDHLQFESLTSARKLDDVSNYPTQKPPFPTKYDIHRPDPPFLSFLAAERARARESFLNAHLRIVILYQAPWRNCARRNSFPLAKSSPVLKIPRNVDRTKRENYSEISCRKIRKIKYNIASTSGIRYYKLEFRRNMLLSCNAN